MNALRSFVTLATLCALTISGASLVQAQDRARDDRHRDHGDAPRVFHKRLDVRAPTLEELDADGDSRVSEAEFVDVRLQRASDLFERLDRDGDGLISVEDREGPPRGEGRRFVMGGERGEEMRACVQSHGVAAAEPPQFALADSDGDSYLSISEWSAALEAQALNAFTDFDTNGDGYIDATEFDARREAQVGQRAEFRDCLQAVRPLR